MSGRLQTRLRRLEARQPSARATLTLVVQYVEPDGTAGKRVLASVSRAGSATRRVERRRADLGSFSCDGIDASQASPTAAARAMTSPMTPEDLADFVAQVRAECDIALTRLGVVDPALLPAAEFRAYVITARAEVTAHLAAPDPLDLDALSAQAEWSEESSWRWRCCVEQLEPTGSISWRPTETSARSYSEPRKANLRGVARRLRVEA